MTALYVIGGILLFFVFLLSLKATVIISYHDEVALAVKVLFIKIPILPKKEKKKGPSSMSPKQAEKIRKKLEKKKEKKRLAKKKKAQKKN